MLPEVIMQIHLRSSRGVWYILRPRGEDRHEYLHRDGRGGSLAGTHPPNYREPVRSGLYAGKEQALAVLDAAGIPRERVIIEGESDANDLCDHDATVDGGTVVGLNDGAALAGVGRDSSAVDGVHGVSGPVDDGSEERLRDWQYEVINDNTRLGYLEWLRRQRDSETGE
jgi:hypothetical protein